MPVRRLLVDGEGDLVDDGVDDGEIEGVEDVEVVEDVVALGCAVVVRVVRDDALVVAGAVVPGAVVLVRVGLVEGGSTDTDELVGVGRPAVVAGAAEVGVSGSNVREPADGLVLPSAGTVTSGTVEVGEEAAEPVGTRPGADPPVLAAGAPELPGEACPAAPPQAASSRAAMP